MAESKLLRRVVLDEAARSRRRSGPRRCPTAMDCAERGAPWPRPRVSTIAGEQARGELRVLRLLADHLGRGLDGEVGDLLGGRRSAYRPAMVLRATRAGSTSGRSADQAAMCCRSACSAASCGAGAGAGARAVLANACSAAASACCIHGGQRMRLRKSERRRAGLGDRHNLLLASRRSGPDRWRADTGGAPQGATRLRRQPSHAASDQPCPTSGHGTAGRSSDSWAPHGACVRGPTGRHFPGRARRRRWPSVYDGGRSHSPLRGSPGFAPGSLLPRPPPVRGWRSNQLRQTPYLVAGVSSQSTCCMSGDYWKVACVGRR